MSSTNTRNPIARKKIQQSVVITGNNGLPVDAITTLESARVLMQGTHSVVYNAGSGTVTLGVGYDLTPIKGLIGKYTGQVLFVDSKDVFYFVDLTTVDVLTRTFVIYLDPQHTTFPLTISVASGWELSEAQLFNRLATTSSTKVDEILFKDIDIQLNLDGDQVKIVDSDGDELQINPDGSLNVNCNIDATDGDNIAISRHDNPFNQTSDANILKAGLSLASFTSVWTYISGDDKIRIGKVKVKSDTLGVFRVKRDGIIQDYFNTSPANPNCVFDFSEHISLVNASILTVEFRPDRLRLATYHFFFRLEGYLEG